MGFGMKLFEQLGSLFATLNTKKMGMGVAMIVAWRKIIRITMM